MTEPNLMWVWKASVPGTVNKGATKIVFPYFPFSLLDKVGQFNTIKVKKPHLVTALNKILRELRTDALVIELFSHQKLKCKNVISEINPIPFVILSQKNFYSYRILI